MWKFDACKKHASTSKNMKSSASLMHEAWHSKPGLWDNPAGWDGEGGGKGVQNMGTHVHLWLIHVNVWQKKKKSQYCN